MGICGTKPYYRIVLLGNVGSGKTTFCKQIVDNYLGGFSQSMRKEFRKHIQANILHRLVSLLNFEEVEEYVEKNEEFKKNFRILENAVVADFDYTDDESFSYVEDVLSAAIMVGESDIVQQIKDSMFLTAPWDFLYFSSMSRIFKKTYQPTKEDIFMCRKPTTGNCEYIIRHLHVEEDEEKDKKKVSEVMIEIIDLGGQKSERKGWEKQIELADAILYLMSLTDYAGTGNSNHNDYYSYLSDSSSINLKYTQELFKENFLVHKTRYVPIILLETKVDLFQTMIEDSKPSMKECFPEYSGPEKDHNRAAFWIRNQIKRNVKAQLKNMLLLRKLDRMPILQQNLTNSDNFKEAFTTIWHHVIRAIDDMKDLEKFTNQRDSSRKSSVREFMINKERAIKVHRRSVQFGPYGPSTATKDEKSHGGSLPLRFLRTKSITGLAALKSPSRGAASIEELISGNNAASPKASRRESLQGVIRSKSYHWN